MKNDLRECTKIILSDPPGVGIEGWGLGGMWGGAAPETLGSRHLPPKLVTCIPVTPSRSLGGISRPSSVPATLAEHQEMYSIYERVLDIHAISDPSCLLHPGLDLALQEFCITMYVLEHPGCCVWYEYANQDPCFI